MKSEILELLLGGVENALGEWSCVCVAFCPEWAVLLKKLQEDIQEMIHDAEIEEDNPVTTGVDMIATERQRQIIEKGYSLVKDAYENDRRQLAMAAACYAMPEDIRGLLLETTGGFFTGGVIKEIWPWERKYWKPTPDNRIRELQKAGALIAAEIDRLLDEGEK